MGAEFLLENGCQNEDKLYFAIGQNLGIKRADIIKNMTAPGLANSVDQVARQDL